MDRLSSEQEALLRRLVDEHPPGVMTTENATHLIVELAESGYLDDYHSFADGTAAFIVGSKGKAYFEALAREKTEEKQKNRHDWALNTVNGVYAIVAAIIGGVVGYLIGIAQAPVG